MFHNPNGFKMSSVTKSLATYFASCSSCSSSCRILASRAVMDALNFDLTVPSNSASLAFKSCIYNMQLLGLWALNMIRQTFHLTESLRVKVFTNDCKRKCSLMTRRKKPWFWILSLSHSWGFFMVDIEHEYKTFSVVLSNNCMYMSTYNVLNKLYQTLFCRSICCRAFSLFCAVLRSPANSAFRLSTWEREMKVRVVGEKEVRKTGNERGIRWCTV